MRHGLSRLSSELLVGRTDEFALLARAATSPPALVIIEGEAGLGKTRLVAELIKSPAMAAGRTVLIGHCHPVRDPFPLGPVVDALRSLHLNSPRLRVSAVVGVLGDLLPELAPYLPTPPAASGDPAVDQHWRWRALAELLNVVGPAVLVLEDLHWADDATGEFLQFLVSQLPDGLAMVLTFRREDLSPASPIAAVATRLSTATASVRIALEPLEPHEVRDMISSILDSPRVSPEFAAFVHERTGGIPLAIEEVLGLLQDRQDLVRLGGQWARRALDELDVPHALRDAILQRVARLGSNARRVARAAAVLRLDAGEDLLAEVAALLPPRAHEGLVEAVEAAVLQSDEGGGYHFRHALAAQAVYDDIPDPQRRRLHERAAKALQQREPPPLGQLAYHYRGAGHPRKWVRYAEAAAMEALARQDYETATRLLLDATAAADLPRATRARLATALGDAALGGLRQAEAIPILRNVLSIEGLAPGTRGLIRYFLGALLHQAGDASGFYEEMKLAVTETSRFPGMQCRAMATLAMPCVPGVDVNEHLAWLQRAKKLASRHPDLGLAMDNRVEEACLVLGIGDLRGLELVADFKSGSKENLVRGCTNLAFHTIVCGQYALAEELIDEGSRVADEVGYYRLAGALAADRLLLHWVTGRWEGLEDQVAWVEEEATGASPSRFQAGMVLGLLRMAQGQIETGEPLLREARDAAYRSGAIPLMGMASASLARARLLGGDVAAARDEAVEALEIISQKGIWTWVADLMPVAVTTLLADGNSADSDGWVARLRDGLAGRNAPAASAALATCEAILAEASSAVETTGLYEKAQRAWASLPRPYEATQVREGLGRYLLEANDDRGVRELLEAMAAFDSLGATMDRDRVRLVLRHHGVALPGRRGRKGHGDDLSPREHEVVDLAARGLTNAQIAERLFLSSRTVEHHIERAIRKLGVSSKAELTQSATLYSAGDHG